MAQLHGVGHLPGIGDGPRHLRNPRVAQQHGCLMTYSWHLHGSQSHNLFKVQSQNLFMAHQQSIGHLPNDGDGARHLRDSRVAEQHGAFR